MTTLKVQRRNMETKAKKLRREGYVTGNLFGKEFEGSIPLQIEKGEADRIQRECMKGSQLYLELEGTTYDVLIKELDFNALDHQILEMDFQALVKGEKVHSVAEVILHNKEKVPEGILEQHLEEIAYKATPENLVEKIEIDCTGMHIGDVLTVGDLAIAKDGKVDIQTSLDAPVVSVVAGRNDTVEDEEEAAAEEPTEEQPEETQEESVETGEAQAQNRETRVKESVNVRSDATTDSDRIALAYQGDAITEIESYDNGWSKVEYKGQTGYVKTEFLE